MGAWVCVPFSKDSRITHTVRICEAEPDEEKNNTQVKHQSASFYLEIRHKLVHRAEGCNGCCSCVKSHMYSEGSHGETIHSWDKKTIRRWLEEINAMPDEYTVGKKEACDKLRIYYVM